MSKTIKVLVVDDHTIVREGIIKLLNIENDIEVIGGAGNAHEGLRLAEKLRPHIIVLDIAMPQMGGLEAIPLLKKVAPETQIIVLSMYGKQAFAQEALQSGAAAYLLKGDNSEELVMAIRTVANGGHFFSEHLRKLMISSFVGQNKESQHSEDAKYQTLSDREKQFFRLMMRGYSTNKISDMMDISYKTGQKHRTSIVKKLGTSSPVELHKYAIRIGIVDPESFNE